MELPLEITTRDVTITKRDENLIRQKSRKLRKFYQRLIGCRVVVEGPGGHHRTGGPYRVRVHMSVPGGEIDVGRQTGDEPTAAIHAAFNAAQRRLQDYARKQRGDVKAREEPPPPAGFAETTT